MRLGTQQGKYAEIQVVSRRAALRLRRAPVGAVGRVRCLSSRHRQPPGPPATAPTLAATAAKPASHRGNYARQPVAAQPKTGSIAALAATADVLTTATSARAHGHRLDGVRPTHPVRRQRQVQPMPAESWDLSSDFKQIKFNSARAFNSTLVASHE
jgi:hypothetical protein